MRFPRASSIVCCLAGAALAALVVWLGRDGFQLAERLGGCQIELRAARSELAAAHDRIARLEREQQGLQGELDRLQHELLRALLHSQALGEVLTDQIERHEQAAVAVRSAEANVGLPPPYGVQRCLATLRECLWADGFRQLRFVSARALENGELRDVELLDLAPDSDAELLVAAAMTAELDRQRGELVFWFRDGFRRAAGIRAALPEAGLPLRLQPVEGRMWEARLPYLVRASGEYPAVDQDRPRRLRGMDARDRAVWIERVDELLAAAGTEHRLRLIDFEDLREGVFTRARVLGYDKGKLLALTADCAGLAFEVDERGGIVSLLFRDGTLRQRGGEAAIGSDGYRVLLPTVTPEQAMHAMLGLVVRR